MGTLDASQFEGIHFYVEDGKRNVVTRNLTPGIQTYGERVVKWQGEEYRLWSPYRSKLSAAILKGLRRLPIQVGSAVLYLGAASGTTASHVSDVVGADGIIYCVEFAPRPMKDLLLASETRENMVPLLADARRPESYAHLVTEVDFIYQDIAQPNQGEIFKSNARAYLAPGGSGILMIKSRSVDVSKDPDEIFRREIDRLRGWGFNVAETIPLDPYDKDHRAVVAAP